MKITRDTPDQLIIENNPVWLAAGVTAFAMVFVAIGIFSIQEDLWLGSAFLGAGLFAGVVFNLAFTRRTMVVFDRPESYIEMRRKSLLGASKRRWALADLDRAIIQSSNSGDTNTYRAALLITNGMDAGTHPITLVYSSGTGAQRASDAINAWHTAVLDSRGTTP